MPCGQEGAGWHALRRSGSAEWHALRYSEGRVRRLGDCAFHNKPRPRARAISGPARCRAGASRRASPCTRSCRTIARCRRAAASWPSAGIARPRAGNRINSTASPASSTESTGALPKAARGGPRIRRLASEYAVARLRTGVRRRPSSRRSRRSRLSLNYRVGGVHSRHDRIGWRRLRRSKIPRRRIGHQRAES